MKVYVLQWDNAYGKLPMRGTKVFAQEDDAKNAIWGILNDAGESTISLSTLTVIEAPDVG